MSRVNIAEFWEKGKPSTYQEFIFQFLKDRGWLPTRDIADSVQTKYPGVPYGSIRRALHRLEKQGLVDRIEVFDREQKVTMNHAGWTIIWRRVPNEP